MSHDISPPDYERFVTVTDGDIKELYLSVEGVYCAACIQKIESHLKHIPQIKLARLNFSTKRLYIQWTGDRSLANQWIAVVQALGYKVKPFDVASSETADQAENRFLLLSLGIAGFAAGNIMLLSAVLWTTTKSTLGVETRDFIHWAAALIAIPSVAFGGQPFFRSAWNALKNKRTNMDVPISLALILCTATSMYELCRHGEHTYFDSAVMLMFFLLIGRYLDFKARARARGSAQDILNLMQVNATIIEDNQSKVVPTRQLQEGMIISVAVGERISADGIVTQGETEIDTSLITGESLPHAVKAGQVVLSGSLNMSAPILLRVQKAPEHSFAADIVRLMENAEQANASYIRLADRVARLYTPVVHIMALGTFVGWLILSSMLWQEALMIAVTVLIITCPCALALAVPVVQVLTVSRLMKNGILIKSGDALERMAAITHVFFDKTGTLTLGRPQWVIDNTIPDDLFSSAASMAVQSRHPLSVALVQAFKGTIVPITVQEFPGKGLQAQWQGQEVRLGSRAWCGADVLPVRDDYLELCFKYGDQPPVIFHFTDPLRQDAAQTIQGLTQRHLGATLLSGDRRDAVEKVAHTLAIHKFFAQMKPQDKYDYLIEAQKTQNILMVGDGLNDAPVLRAANVSMSPSTAIDVAQNSADIVFMGDRLGAVTLVYDVARFSQRLVWQNFALTAVYNLIAVPMAVMGHVTPLVAAIAMSSSSLLVIANSFRMRLKL